MDQEEKSKVLSLIGEGLSSSEVARRIGRLERAVRYVRKAAATLGTGTTPGRKVGTGRRKTHPGTDSVLEQEVKKDLFITAKELKEIHANVLGNVSPYRSTPPTKGPEAALSSHRSETSSNEENDEAEAQILQAV